MLQTRYYKNQQNLIDIFENLAAMLQLTMLHTQKAASEETAFAIYLVAGVGFEPTTFRL